MRLPFSTVALPPQRRQRPVGRPERRGGGFSLMEVVIAAVVILLLSSYSINAALTEWRSQQAYALAEELAGWLVLVQRAAMRGTRCDVAIASSSSTVSSGQTLAKATEDSGGSLTNSCSAYSPMRLESTPAGVTFSISPSPLTFSFTPRGTIANTSRDPVVITVTNQAGGSVRCIRLDGLLGIARLGTMVGGSCQA